MFLHLDWNPPLVNSIDWTWFGKAQIWGRLQKISAALKVPKSTVASIIHKWKKFGITRTLPRAHRPAKLSNRGRRALIRKVTKNLYATLAELQRSCGEIGFQVQRSSILSGMSGRNQAPIITCPIPPQWWSMVGAASCCGGIFQWQGCGDWSGLRETKYWVILN